MVPQRLLSSGGTGGEISDFQVSASAHGSTTARKRSHPDRPRGRRAATDEIADRIRVRAHTVRSLRRREAERLDSEGTTEKPSGLPAGEALVARITSCAKRSASPHHSIVRVKHLTTIPRAISPVSEGNESESVRNRADTVSRQATKTIAKTASVDGAVEAALGASAIGSPSATRSPGPRRR